MKYLVTPEYFSAVPAQIFEIEALKLNYEGKITFKVFMGK